MFMQRYKFIGKLLLYFSFIFYIFADGGIFSASHTKDKDNENLQLCYK
jgi:hypothetical protein